MCAYNYIYTFFSSFFSSRKVLPLPRRVALSLLLLLLPKTTSAYFFSSPFSFLSLPNRYREMNSHASIKENEGKYLSACYDVSSSHLCLSAYYWASSQSIHTHTQKHHRRGTQTLLPLPSPSPSVFPCIYIFPSRLRECKSGPKTEKYSTWIKGIILVML